MLANEVDLGFTEGVLEDDNLIKPPFSRYRLVFCLPPGSAAAGKTLALDQLGNRRGRCKGSRAAIRDSLDSALRSGASDPDQARLGKAVNSQVLKQAALAGWDCAFTRQMVRSPAIGLGRAG